MLITSKPRRGIKKERIALFMIKLSVLLTVISQFFIESGYYQIVRLFLYIAFAGGFLSIFAVNPTIKKERFVILYLGVVYATIISSLFASLFNGGLIISPLIEVTLPFFLLLIGYQSTIESKELGKLIFKYMILVTLLGLFVIFIFGNGFTITDQYYFSSKNQVGPFIASATLISSLLLLNGNRIGDFLVRKNWLLIIFFVNFSTLLALRNRSGLVAIGVCLLVFMISKNGIRTKYNKKSLLKFPFMVVVMFLIIVTGIGKPVYDVVYSSLFQNYDVTDLNSLSANRFDVYVDVWNFLKISPYLGEVSAFSGITEIPHNYLLNIGLNYGVFGMLPLIIFYIYVWGYVLGSLLIKRRFDLSLYLLLFMLIISLFEYTYPYGPMTTVSLTWILLGNNLKIKTKTININSSHS